MINVPVATGSNRVNSSGNLNATGPLSRTSIIFPLVIPAGQVGAVPIAGTTFYVTVATAPVDIRPLNGVFSRYVQGQGLKVQTVNAFPALEVKNPNANAVVVQVFVGFDDMIDNRLILANTGQQLVANPTYPTASAAANIDILDLSGGPFTDINGEQWLALQREAIYVFNPDAGVTLLLQEFGSVVANGPAVAVIYPVTSLRYAAGGNYTINVGGGNINAIVSELYQAIPAVPSVA